MCDIFFEWPHTMPLLLVNNSRHWTMQVLNHFRHAHLLLFHQHTSIHSLNASYHIGLNCVKLPYVMQSCQTSVIQVLLTQQSEHWKMQSKAGRRPIAQPPGEAVAPPSERNKTNPGSNSACPLSTSESRKLRFTGRKFTKFPSVVEESLPFNLLKSKLRSTSLFWSASPMNDSGVCMNRLHCDTLALFLC